jgi:endoglucanase
VKQADRRFLESILRLPTAPFREHWVAAALERAARRSDLTVKHDRYGNLYVGYRKARAEPVAFTAHMDHPGFEVTDGGARARGVFLGGVPAEFLSGAHVVCYADIGARDATGVPPEPVRGRIARVSPRAGAGRRPDVVLDLDFEAPVAAGSFGCFDLPCEVDGATLRGRALDNLLSCALILTALAELKRRGTAADVLAVFTRAEEVGLIGAGGVLRSPILAPDRPLVVLETSKEMPGFRIGAGPVVRVGDRMTAFDPRMDLWLADRAAALAGQEPDFAFQRALMTGGSCEASLYVLHGRPVGALALALGNYHNMTAEVGIGAEYVSTDDAENLGLFLAHLATHPPDPALVHARRAELDAAFERLSPRLRPPA